VNKDWLPQYGALEKVKLPASLLFQFWLSIKMMKTVCMLGGDVAHSPSLVPVVDART
jgi:hypothetical protein